MDKKGSKYIEDGMNKNTFELLFKDFENLNMDEEIKKNGVILTAIEYYTKIREKSIFEGLVTKSFSNKIGIDLSKIEFNREKEKYEISIDDEIYDFNKLSKILGDKEIKKELESDERYGKCHAKSEWLLGKIPKTSILTGYVQKFDAKYLHSVIEYNGGNEDIIIDWTKNLVMNKEDYIKLTHFEEIEHMTDIEFMEIMKKINFLVGKNMVTHLTFGRELLNEIERKGLIYEENPERKKRLDKLIESRIQINKKINKMKNKRENKQKEDSEEER